MARNILIIALLTALCTYSSSLHAQLSDDPADTVVGRGPHYWYYGWYDECPRYEDDTNHFLLRHLTSVDGSARQILVAEQNAFGRMAIKGVAVMVSIDPGQDIRPGQFMPSTDSTKMPEYLNIYQGGPAIPGLSHYYNPVQMILIDSIRWDTAAPKVMALPLTSQAIATNDTSRMLYCHVYEALFDTALLVMDTFYISGSFRSNVFDYDTVLLFDTIGDSVFPHPSLRCRFRHFPTDYVTVWDNYTEQCEKCEKAERLFFGYDPVSEELLEVYNYLWFMAGPFLPIVDYYELSAAPNDSGRGVVMGGGRFPYRSLRTISATAFEGFHFSRWSDGVTDNPRVVDVMGDLSVIAIFE